MNNDVYLDQLFEGHTCTNCNFDITCDREIKSPCDKWKPESQTMKAVKSILNDRNKETVKVFAEQTIDLEKSADEIIEEWVITNVKRRDT